MLTQRLATLKKALILRVVFYRDKKRYQNVTFILFSYLDLSLWAIRGELVTPHVRVTFANSHLDCWLAQPTQLTVRFAQELSIPIATEV